MQARRMWWSWPMLVLALLIVGTLDLAGCTGSSASTPATAQRTATATARSTPTAPPTAASQQATGFADPATLGWVRSAAPRPADAIAVAPGSPGTVFACSEIAGQNGQPLITLSLSTDGGSSWHTQDTTIPLARCLAVAVSPATPRSIAIYASTCRSDCGQGYNRLYLSIDAGSHWMQVSPSPDSDSALLFGWVGAAFVATVVPDGTSPATRQFLAVSRDGVHFAWTSLPVVPQGLFASGSTLYVVAGSTASCSVASNLCTDLYRSSDLGASWSRMTPAFQGINVRAVAIVPGGSTLVGFDARAFADNPNLYPLVRSLDGGASWQRLPDAPEGMVTSTGTPILTPDGTVYVFFCCGGGANAAITINGIYKLAPGSARWALVSPVVPAQVNVVAASWDAAGQPAKLWGLHPMFPNTSSDATDLWSLST